MQEQTLHTKTPPCAQGAKPYSDEEEQIFIGLMGEERIPTTRLLELFPDRTPSAVRSKLHKTKVAQGMGIKPRERASADGTTQVMLAPDDLGTDDDAHERFEQNCIQGSRMLAEALQNYRLQKMLA